MSSKQVKNISVFITALIILFITGSCFTMRYSFTGASIDPALQTVSVQFIENRAQLIQPGLDQQFTDELKDYIQSNTSLKLVNGFGDVDFDGEITGYTVLPTSIGANNQAAENKFTIAVRIQYTNTADPDLDFDSSFSRFRNYDSNEDFDQVKEQLTEEIIDELVEQIYNKAFVNW